MHTQFREFERETRKLLKKADGDLVPYRKAVITTRAEVENIMNAIRAGIVTPTTKSALIESELALKDAERKMADAETTRPCEILPRAREVYRELVANLEKIEDIPAARESIRGLLGGQIRIVRDADGIWAEAEKCQLALVAGAGFEPTTFGL